MKRLVLLLCCLFLSYHAWGQQNMLRLVPNSFQVTNLTTGMSGSDTLFMSYGDSLMYEARAILSGPTSVVDEIGLGIAQDSIMAQGTDSLYAGLPADTLLANDTLVIQILDQVDSMLARYSGGTGGGALVVVVWPVLRTQPSITENSTSIIFNFGEYTAIDDPLVWQRLRVQCYPNPTTDQLYFQLKESNSRFEYVRISTLDGQVLFKEESLPPSVDMSRWASGLYVLEIKYRDGIREVMKLQKQ